MTRFKPSAPEIAVLLFLGAALCLSRIPAAAQELSPPSPLSFTHYKLANGLQVILAEDYTLPVVSVAVTYRVGSADDPPGRAGLAYLLENLMFLGSANVTQMQHVGFINRVGGQLSAAVEEDRTVFYETVPANHLALVLWLESDRMGFLQPSVAKVESSKLSLIEEVRQRTLQDPFAQSTLAFDRLLYPDYAVSHPALGLENDLLTMSAEDVRNFYSTYYVPNNAVLCICGNINKSRARELVARYFDGLPRGREPLPSRPPQRYVKFATTQVFQEPRARVCGFWLGFRIPTPDPQDIYGLTVLDAVLFRGRSSRLYRRLWQRERLVLSLSGGLERREGLLSYRLFATNTNSLLVNRSLSAIFAELQRVKSSFIGEEELTKAKNIVKRDYYDRFATTLDKALALSDACLTLKNLDDFPNELNRFLRVTPQVLVGLANRYFTAANAIIATINTR